MSDLIRREDVLNSARADGAYDYVSTSEILEIPAVDAVEVVRCYKCKHWEPMNKGSWMNRNRTDGVCRALMEFRLAERYMTEKDHFCGYGERRKENE